MQSLYSWEVSKLPLERLLEFEWVDRKDGREDTFAFARLMIAGVIEHIEEVDNAIQVHLEHWDIARLSKVDLSILRVAAYALLFQADVPASVTIDEAIDIAKEYGTDESYKFVNGVLDAIRRDSRK